MPRILLLDDDIAEISAVKRVLSRAGHQPVLATNASDAATMLAEERPALLVLAAACDGGEAVALAFRLAEAGEGPPVLVLGEATPLPAGARSVKKPIDPEELQAEVRAALGEARATAPEPAAAEAVIEPRSPAAATAPPPAAAAAPVPARAAPAARSGPAPDSAAAALADALRAATRPPPAAAPAGRARPLARRVSTSAHGSGAVAAELSPLVAAPAPAPLGSGPPDDDAPLASAPVSDDAAAARRAAAEALRARAAELRRAAAPSSGPAAPAARIAPPAAAPAAPAPPDESGPSPTSAAFAALDPLPFELEERSPVDDARRAAAEEALRALEEEASAAAVQAARRAREEQRRQKAEREAQLEAARREAEARVRRETEEAAKAADAERARREAELDAERARREAALDAERQAEARAREAQLEAARRESEERARGEADEARRARDAEEKAAAEAEARHRAEEELAKLRAQLEEERRSADQRIATVMQRAQAEESAAEELRRMAEDEARRRAEADARAREEEEEKLRTAIASARAELESLRRRGDEEAQRRAEAEAELRRVTASASAAEPRRAAPAAHPLSDDVFEDERTGLAPLAEAPPPDPAEEAARRRVAALRAGGEPPPEYAPPVTRAAPPAAWAAPPPQPEPPPAVREPWPPPPPAPARARTPAAPPPPPELRDGSLAELPAPRLFALAARHRLTGRVEFQGDAARALWFEDGRLVGATSADPSERIEELALRLGLVTRDQHRQIAQAAAALPTRRAALLLLERGFLKPNELTGLVRRRTEEVAFGMFADPDARFRWAPAEVPPEERIALERGSLVLAIEGVRRRWLAPQVDAVLGGPATLLGPSPGGPALEELGLSPEERRAVALADGLRALDEILEASPLDALTTRQVLAALVLVGGLTVRLVLAGRPQAAAASAIDLARVREKLEQVRRADYFTVLGVGRLCTPHEVREAADRLQAEFDPARFEGVPEDGLEATLAEIVQVVRDAREVLESDRLRQEYLRGLGDAVS